MSRSEKRSKHNVENMNGKYVALAAAAASAIALGPSFAGSQPDKAEIQYTIEVGADHLAMMIECEKASLSGSYLKPMQDLEKSLFNFGVAANVDLRTFPKYLADYISVRQIVNGYAVDDAKKNGPDAVTEMCNGDKARAERHLVHVKRLSRQLLKR